MTAGAKLFLAAGGVGALAAVRWAPSVHTH
jgi:hypothetical protein